MNILVTGAKGFVGKNLVENLKNVRDGKDKTRLFTVDNIFEYELYSLHLLCLYFFYCLIPISYYI